MNAPRLTKRARLRTFLETNQSSVAAISLGCLAIGALLAHSIEPGVRIEEVMLARDTPALKYVPRGVASPPVALLAHGYGGEKNNVFCFAEALTAAGFLCYAIDLPGHGESPRLYTFMDAVRTIGDLEKAIGPVDVLIGHSLGGTVAGEAVREKLLRPQLVIGVGSSPRLGDNPPPLLLLIGRYDEIHKPEEIKARADAQSVISPWSNHGAEGFDRRLINAAVRAACAAVGKGPPARLTHWWWRIVGNALVTLGALGLALVLPAFAGRWSWLRGLLVAAVFFGAFALAKVDWKPHWMSVPAQMTAAAIALVVLAAAGKLRVRRWIFLPVAALLLIACLAGRELVMAKVSIGAFSILLFSFKLAVGMLAGTLIGFVADLRGPRLAGDIAMAAVIGCSIFPMFTEPRGASAPPEPGVFMKLDPKLGDAVAGHYEFPPDNVFPNGARVAIWREDDHLFLQITGWRGLQGAWEIFPESETNFFLKAYGAQLSFIRNGNGEVQGLIHHYAGWPDSRAGKVDSQPPKPAEAQ